MRPSTSNSVGSVNMELSSTPLPFVQMEQPPQFPNFPEEQQVNNENQIFIHQQNVIQQPQMLVQPQQHIVQPQVFFQQQQPTQHMAYSVNQMPAQQQQMQPILILNPNHPLGQLNQNLMMANNQQLGFLQSNLQAMQPQPQYQQFLSVSPTVGHAQQVISPGQQIISPGFSHTQQCSPDPPVVMPNLNQPPPPLLNVPPPPDVAQFSALQQSLHGDKQPRGRQHTRFSPADTSTALVITPQQRSWNGRGRSLDKFVMFQRFNYEAEPSTSYDQRHTSSSTSQRSFGSSPSFSPQSGDSQHEPYRSPASLDPRLQKSNHAESSRTRQSEQPRRYGATQPLFPASSTSKSNHQSGRESVDARNYSEHRRIKEAKEKAEKERLYRQKQRERQLQRINSINESNRPAAGSSGSSTRSPSNSSRSTASSSSINSINSTSNSHTSNRNSTSQVHSSPREGQRNSASSNLNLPTRPNVVNRPSSTVTSMQVSPNPSSIGRSISVAPRAPIFRQPSTSTNPDMTTSTNASKVKSVQNENLPRLVSPPATPDIIRQNKKRPSKILIRLSSNTTSPRSDTATSSAIEPKPSNESAKTAEAGPLNVQDKPAFTAKKIKMEETGTDDIVVENPQVEVPHHAFTAQTIKIENTGEGPFEPPIDLFKVKLEPPMDNAPESIQDASISQSSPGLQQSSNENEPSEATDPSSDSETQKSKDDKDDEDIDKILNVFDDPKLLQIIGGSGGGEIISYDPRYFCDYEEELREDEERIRRSQEYLKPLENAISKFVCSIFSVQSLRHFFICTENMTYDEYEEPTWMKKALPSSSPPHEGLDPKYLNLGPESPVPPLPPDDDNMME